MMLFQPHQFPNPEKECDTLDTMEKRGGSFVVGLAGLYRKADPINKARLRMTFWMYFEKYLDW
jgi:hypothetical protein